MVDQTDSISDDNVDEDIEYNCGQRQLGPADVATVDLEDLPELNADERDENWLESNTPRIERGSRIVENALILSNIVYKTNPKLSFEKEKTSMSLAAVTEKSEEQQFLVAQDTDNKEVYIAFKGTDLNQAADLITNIKICIESAESVEGEFHDGYCKRAENFPLSTILKSKSLSDKNFIFCGHSLGGAVSAIVHLTAFQQIATPGKRWCFNITFGAPLFASRFPEIVNAHNYMFHFIAENDPIPSALRYSISIPYLKQNFPIENAMKIFNFGANFENTLAHIKQNPAVKETTQLLSLDLEQLDKYYQPVGTFLYISSNSEPFKNVKGHEIDKLLEKNLTARSDKTDVSCHWLSNYERLILSVNSRSESCPAPRTILDPTIAKCSLNFIEFSNSDQRLKINLEGKNLDTKSYRKVSIFSVSSNQYLFENNTKVLSDSRLFPLIITIKNVALDLNKFMPLSISITTVFGQTQEVQVSCDQFTQLAPPVCSMDDVPVSECLEMAFNRCLALKDNPGVLNYDYPLNKCMSELCSEIFVGNQELLQKSERLEEEHKVDLIEGICKFLNEPLKLSWNREKKTIGLGAASLFMCSAQIWYFPKYYIIGCVGAMLTIWYGIRSHMNVRAADNYNEVLKYISEKLADSTKKGSSKEIQGLLDSGTLHDKEKAISSMIVKKTKMDIAKIKEWENLQSGSQEKLSTFIKVISTINEIRALLFTTKLVGIVGPRNTGKTKLMRELCPDRAEDPNILEATKKIQIAKANADEDLFIVDFPGFGTLKEHAKTFERIGSMCNIFVIVLWNRMAVDNLVFDSLKKVLDNCRVEDIYKLIICFNGTGGVLDDLSLETDNRSILGESKFQFAEEINEYLTENEIKIKITADNIEFTDWKDIDVNRRLEYKVCDAQQVLEMVQERLGTKRPAEKADEDVPTTKSQKRC